jgi:hypothetical protein
MLKTAGHELQKKKKKKKKKKKNEFSALRKLFFGLHCRVFVEGVADMDPSAKGFDWSIEREIRLFEVSTESSEL